MVARTLAAAREAGLEVTVWFTPGIRSRDAVLAGRELRRAPSGVRTSRRAARAAARSADADRPWLALLGECPGIDATLLREAAEIAERGDLVLGPTDDGGYYLIGGVPPLPDVFTAMPWGSDRLLAETRTRLAHLGASWRELRSLTLVETIEHARAEWLLT